MKHLQLLLLCYAAVVLQVGLRPDLSWHGVSPDFLLLAMSAAVIGRRGSAAIIWAAVIGFLADCLSAGLLGLSMFSAIAAATAVLWLVPQSRRSSLSGSTGVSFLLTFIVLSTSAAARTLIDGRVVDGPRLLIFTAGAAAYTAVLFCGLRIVYGILERGMRSFSGTAEPPPRASTAERYS